MLNDLLNLLETRSNGLSLHEISRSLNAQPSAVQPMLELLVRRGRLVEIGPDGRICADCGLAADCNLLATRGKRFAVIRVI